MFLTCAVKLLCSEEGCGGSEGLLVTCPLWASVELAGPRLDTALILGLTLELTTRGCAGLSPWSPTSGGSAPNSVSCRRELTHSCPQTCWFAPTPVLTSSLSPLLPWFVLSALGEGPQDSLGCLFLRKFQHESVSSSWNSPARMTRGLQGREALL